MFQKTAMADAKSASLKQTEIENSFTEMKAILEALRKEVSQINAGTPDPNLTRCDTSSLSAKDSKCLFSNSVFT